jgi:hypothetical protein
MKDRPRALAVLIAVFLAGTIVGASGSYFWLKKPTEPPIRIRGNGRLPRGGGPNLPEFLKLTPEQEKRGSEIMAESRRQLEALRREQTPKIEAIRNETNRKLFSILNEEQKKSFEDMLKKWEEMQKQEPRRRGPGPPPPR